MAPKKAPPKQTLPTASVLLRANPIGVGLQVLMEGMEGRNAPVILHGREAVRSTSVVSGAKFIYFKITNQAFKNGKSPMTAITIIYFDEGSGDIIVQYDSLDDTTNQGPFKIVTLARLENSRTWKSGVVDIADARFSGRCNGYDFRIAVPTGVDLAVSSVKLESLATPFLKNFKVPAVRWRIINTKYPTLDTVVAGYSVTEFGAKGDGVTDNTAAFQMAMNAMAKAGGGTVFVPEGRYVIRRYLNVPTSVTLRGEWRKPSAGKLVGGTVLMAYAGRGESKGRPFIVLNQCTGIKDMTIWYPEQKAEDIVPYPYCIRQANGMSVMMENITLVNPYQGIQIGPDQTELHYIKNLYGTPLLTGIQFDFISDIGRLENLHLSPDIWSDSGLPGAPPRNGAHAKWMYQNGTALRTYRCDWQYAAFVNISGYKTGFEIAPASQGSSNAQYYGFRITNCASAVTIVDALYLGIMFTESTLHGDEHGVVTEPAFTSKLMFHSCSIKGSVNSVLFNGRSGAATLFHGCTFEGTYTQSVGDLSLLGCTFNSPAEHIVLGAGVNAATIAGSIFTAVPQVLNNSTSKQVKISDQPVKKSAIPKYRLPEGRGFKPARRALFVVTDKPYGAVMNKLHDDTQAIQKALNAAAKGGGIVFCPGGEYAIRGQLTIPTGVELRGVYEVPHHTIGKGSTFRLFMGRNDASGAPAITMKRNSSLRGMTFMYPEQKHDALVPYSPMVQGQGDGIIIANITAMNPWYMLDFKSYKCDRHFIDYPAGAPLRMGIAVGGGCVGGEVLNTQFNPHYWNRSPYVDGSGGPEVLTSNNVWQYSKENLEAFVLGHAVGERLFQNFVFGSKFGLHCISENGRGASGVVFGHGVDGSKVGAAFDGLSPAGIDLINPEFACFMTTESAYASSGEQLRSNARLYNSMLWGSPDHSAVVKGGTLLFELAHFWTYSGFVADKGTLALTNTYLSNNTIGADELTIRNGGHVALTGNNTAFGMACNADAPATSVTEQFEVQRNQPIPRNAREISVTLTNPQLKAGLSLRESDAETTTKPVMKDGRPAWTSTMIPAHAKGAYMMYIAVEYPGFKSGKVPAVKLSLDYFDEGIGDFRIVYDSSDESVQVVKEHPGAWKQAAAFPLTNSGKWKSFECTIRDAKFAGRCNGGDLRFEITSGAVQPAIGLVKLTRL